MVKPRRKGNAVFRGRRPDSALKHEGSKNKLAAKLTRDALIQNLDIAEKLGCPDEGGLMETRKGKSPSVRKGPRKGDELSVQEGSGVPLAADR